MTLRSDEGTLTDDHADEVMTNVLTALREKLGAERR